MKKDNDVTLLDRLNNVTLFSSALSNVGTSEGAKKGWESRHGTEASGGGGYGLPSTSLDPRQIWQGEKVPAPGRTAHDDLYDKLTKEGHNVSQWRNDPAALKAYHEATKATPKATHELYYSDGGHGGPYHSQADAVEAAHRLLRGSRNMKSVEIRPSHSEHRGGYGDKHATSTYVHKDAESEPVSPHWIRGLAHA